MDITALFVSKSQKVICLTISGANGNAVTRTQLAEAIGRRIEQQDVNFIDRLVEAGAVHKYQDPENKVWYYKWIGE